MAYNTNLLLRDLQLRRIGSGFSRSDIFRMARNTRGRLHVTRQQCFAMSRRQIFFFHVAMTFTATLNDVRRIKFCSGNFWRLDIVLAVAFLAHPVRISPAFWQKGIMKRMFRRNIFVARLTFNRRDLFFMRNVVRVESCVTRYTDKCLVRGMSKHLVVDIQ